MKKSIFILMTAALAFTAVPYIPAPADYSSTAAAENDTQLSTAASLLGAENYHFSFKNYTKNYLDTDIIVSGCEDQSYGISMLQILSHNGVFAISDIQEGAQSLSDIELTDELKELIESYQLTRFNNPQIRTARNFTKNDLQTLIETATTSMIDGKYFHISLSMPEELQFNSTRYNRPLHDVVGIGLSSGEWSFNGKIYDKCVLTLDSNAPEFNEDYCIYINTSDNTFCIPAYELADSEYIEISAVIADDTILNYNGKLGEQVQPPADITDNTGTIPENAVKLNVSTSFNYEYTVEAGSNVYDLLYLERNPTIITNIADSYKLECKPEAKGNANIHFSADSEKGYTYIYSSALTSAEISEHSAVIKSGSDDEGCNIILRPAEPLYKSDYTGFRAFVSGIGTFSMTDRPDGILLSSDTSYTADVNFYKYDENNKESETYKFKIEPSAGNLLIKYDEDTEKIRAFIDTDGNDIYETEIQNGDVNCDGIFDASDASKILDAYAQLSTSDGEDIQYISLFTDYDSDGFIDATDAAEVLKKYAENSTLSK